MSDRPADTIGELADYLWWLLPAFLKKKDRAEALAARLCEVWGDVLDETRTTLIDIIPELLASTATGEYLDMLARVRQVFRGEGESDESLRSRVLAAYEIKRKGGTIPGMEDGLAAIGYDAVVSEPNNGTDKWSRFVITILAWDVLVTDQGIFYDVVRLLKPAHTRALIESELPPGTWDDWALLAPSNELDEGDLDDWTDVFPVKALDLDGVDEYVACPNPGITDKLSVVAWVNCDTLGDRKTIVASGNDGGPDLGFVLCTNSVGPYRQLRIYVSTDGTYDAATMKYYFSTSANALPSSGWAMVSFTWDEGALIVSVNAVAEPMTKAWDPAITTIFSPAGPFCIGANPGWNNKWDGPVCNVSIWKDAVTTPADLLALFSAGAGMDPMNLAPSDGAVLAHSYLWDTELPLVPGANDIPDRVGPNPGTTVNVEAEDVVDSPFLD